MVFSKKKKNRPQDPALFPFPASQVSEQPLWPFSRHCLLVKYYLGPREAQVSPSKNFYVRLSQPAHPAVGGATDKDITMEPAPTSPQLPMRKFKQGLVIYPKVRGTPPQAAWHLHSFTHHQPKAACMTPKQHLTPSEASSHTQTPCYSPNTAHHLTKSTEGTPSDPSLIPQINQDHARIKGLAKSHRTGNESGKKEFRS